VPVTLVVSIIFNLSLFGDEAFFSSNERTSINERRSCEWYFGVQLLAEKRFYRNEDGGEKNTLTTSHRQCWCAILNDLYCLKYA
jgi:hypothetical protein